MSSISFINLKSGGASRADEMRARTCSEIPHLTRATNVSDFLLYKHKENTLLTDCRPRYPSSFVKMLLSVCICHHACL